MYTQKYEGVAMEVTFEEGIDDKDGNSFGTRLTIDTSQKGSFINVEHEEGVDRVTITIRGQWEAEDLKNAMLRFFQPRK